MIIGIGCDTVEIQRVEKLIEKETAVNRIFTPKERELFLKQSNKVQWAAGRYAAKEAASKALKVGISRCPLNCVEVLYDDNGAPTLSFIGDALKLVEGINVESHISITHDAGIAIAFVVLEKLQKEVAIKDLAQIKEIAKLLPPRKPESHKGDMGKIAILAGSKKYAGAGYLCTLGALRGGAGLVTWCRDFKTKNTPPESISYELPSKKKFKDFIEFCSDKDCLVIGPGLGIKFASKAVKKTIGRLNCPIVYDADALNAMAAMEQLPKLNDKTILTPHIGEAARMLKKDIDFVAKNTLVCSKELAKKTGAITVLKSHETVVSSPEGELFINTSGNAGMATGGSGDVLAGLIGALAKRLSPFDAARYAVYLHGLAGDIAKMNKGDNSMTAMDIALSVSEAFLIIEKYK